MKNKKTPATTTKKKTLAAATSRSWRKAARETARSKQSNDGSYLFSDTHLSSDTLDIPSTSAQATTSDISSNTLLAFLHKLDDSNKQIVHRIDDLEKRNIPNSTPSHSPSHHGRAVTIDDHPMIHGRSFMTGSLDPLRSKDLFASQPVQTGSRPATHQKDDGHTTSNSTLNDQLGRSIRTRPVNSDPVTVTNLQFNDTAFRSANELTATQLNMPTLDSLRRMPSVNDAVSQLLSHYEQGNTQELLQGKAVSKRSGRYNNSDTSTLQPHLRWPNEGFTGGGTKKRISYDDLTLPQWVAGQLTNAIQIQDNDVLRSVLNQIIFAMRDASSLPWSAVREAYASSMHEVEEGRLAWSDSTQWALNRLSASQVALANSRTLSQQNKGRTCKFYNEGACSHEGYHGIYKHNCSHCWKQGRTHSHPETKCHYKGAHKQQDKQK